MGGLFLRRAEKMHHRLPPSVERLLEAFSLASVSRGEVYDAVMSKLQVKRFFGTNPLQGTAIGAIATPRVGELVYNSARIDKPRYKTRVGPCQGWIVENVRVPGSARQEIADHFFARFSKRFSSAVKELSVANFVLYFGEKAEFSLESRSTGNPGSFGEGTDYFAVGMLLDHADELLPV